MAITAYRPRRSLLALIGVGILALTLHAIGSAAVIDALQRCHPAAIALAAVAIMMGTVLGAWNCYVIAELRSAMSFRRFLPIYWRSWAIGISLPGQVADFLSTLWQLKGRSGELSLVAGRLLVDKAITLGLILALATLLPALIGEAEIQVPLMLLGLLCIGAVLGLWSLGWAVANIHVAPRNPWISRVLPIASAARQTPPRLVLSNGLLTLVKLMISGIAYWLVLRSIDSNTPDLLTTTVIAQSVGLIAYVPISFNGLGTVEVSAVGLFRSVGMSGASVLSAYLILRALTLIAAWIPTAVGMLRTTPGNR
jgi:uncharacterized membrane protein YbhN (UPF0104 family)